jgi:hypothetical protein
MRKRNEPVTMKRPERGPIPVDRSLVTLNADVDVLQRRLGTTEESAATIEDLSDAGVITKTSDGSFSNDPVKVSGPQSLYNFLKGFN